MPKATFRQTRTPLKLEHLQKAREDPMGPDALQSGVVFGIWIIGSPPPTSDFEGSIWGGIVANWNLSPALTYRDLNYLSLQVV